MKIFRIYKDMEKNRENREKNRESNKGNFSLF